MSSKLKSIKKRFIDTMFITAASLNEPVLSIKRDDYVRFTVENDIKDRLNKEELNLIGGFKEAKKLFIENNLAKYQPPKVLVFDIETSPIEALVWNIWDQNIPLSMVKKDWCVLAWAAKWLGDSSKKVVYRDTFNQKDKRDDSLILKDIWKMLDEADFVVGHNSNSFDIKKLNARFIQLGMKAPSSYKKFDTKKLAKKHFGFTSNKLAYITDKLCTKYKKLNHSEFPGNYLWIEYLKGNKKAQKEMKTYNIYDVLSLEEAFLKILPWESANLFENYSDADITICTCGGIDFSKAGFHTTQTGKYQKYRCKNCGAEMRGTNNLLTNTKRKLSKRSIK